MKVILLIIAIIASTLCSCTKDKPEPRLTNDCNVKKDILVFDTFEEYNTTIYKTISMSSSELKDLEESLGFKSFGRKCEEIYFSINFDTLKSYGELVNIVNENSKYLRLVKKG